MHNKKQYCIYYILPTSPGSTSWGSESQKLISATVYFTICIQKSYAGLRRFEQDISEHSGDRLKSLDQKLTVKQVSSPIPMDYCHHSRQMKTVVQYIPSGNSIQHTVAMENPFSSLNVLSKLAISRSYVNVVKLTVWYLIFSFRQAHITTVFGGLADCPFFPLW